MNSQNDQDLKTSQDAATVEAKVQAPIAIEGDDFDLPVCGLNPNDPAFAGCEACQ
jgi:hypothetical protein